MTDQSIATQDLSPEVIARAEALKVEANKLFKDHHFQAAISAYDQAIELNPNVAAYYSNRALAHIRMESFGYAVSDADKALEVDPTFFEKAIASDEDVRSAVDALGDIDSIVVEESYAGPRLEADGTVTPEFVLALMDHFKDQKMLHKKFAYQILVQAKRRFEAMKSLIHIAVPSSGRLTICGDTHGQFYDLLHIFELNGVPSPTNTYLFNGDMVDRGSFSVEIIFTLLAWSLAYPDPDCVVYMARGNHEALDMNRMYGFEGEVKHKFNPATFNVFTEVFNAMPLVHIVSEKLFVVHGGLPSTDGVTLEQIEKINRFRQPTGNDIMNDLLWADPQEHPGRGPSKRGTGFQFGPDVTRRFLELNNLDMVIRSHEVKENGYEITHDGKCVTIFSAPNYCDAVGNLGAYIHVSPSLELKYEQFEAVPHPDVSPMKYSPMRGFGG
ncbi:Metallo-dependent phosphatase-like protein [Catenaria anguillulae PL171]|uniref:protein-serine/threonine phosphatase n=1 Tax=Catenaria anguillulae PL171 TaxID=765915 RepID=A0A1Y2HLH3_9FUNG|nr:Metallo-dependent phosphatase-like protein [Catenaria anguillulae PL171]